VCVCVCVCVCMCVCCMHIDQAPYPQGRRLLLPHLQQRIRRILDERSLDVQTVQ